MTTRTSVTPATLSAVAAFVGCILLANWAIVNIGTFNGPDLPRTIPVGPNLAAPSGALFAGAMFTLRDTVHERLGTPRTLGVIMLSTPLSAAFAAPALATASVATFVLAEVVDLAVYQRLRLRGYTAAVVGSNVVASIIDSVVFLTLAFGMSQALAGALGMTIGKLEASLVLLAFMALIPILRRNRHRFGRVARRSTDGGQPIR